MVACSDDDPAPMMNTLDVSITSTSDAECGESTGSIMASATGASGSVSFAIDGNNFQNSGTFDNLPPGEYVVTAKDQEGNTGVSDPMMVLSGVSFSTAIQPIIDANCAVSGCHDGSRSDIPNWSIKNNVLSNASKIKSRTTAKTMPPPNSGRSITDEQISLIACWVDDGAPDN